MNIQNPHFIRHSWYVCKWHKIIRFNRNLGKCLFKRIKQDHSFLCFFHSKSIFLSLSVSLTPLLFFFLSFEKKKKEKTLKKRQECKTLENFKEKNCKVNKETKKGWKKTGENPAASTQNHAVDMVSRAPPSKSVSLELGATAQIRARVSHTGESRAMGRFLAFAINTPSVVVCSRSRLIRSSKHVLQTVKCGRITALLTRDIFWERKKWYVVICVVLTGMASAPFDSGAGPTAWWRGHGPHPAASRSPTASQYEPRGFRRRPAVQYTSLAPRLFFSFITR